jgi:hypothetical protein
MIGSKMIEENCLERGMNCAKRQQLYWCFVKSGSKGTLKMKGIDASLIPQEVRAEYL